MYIKESIWREYLDNNSNLFIIVSKSFLEDFKSFGDNLNVLIKEKGIKKIHELLHELKGVVLNIGADILYDSIEEALVFIRKEELDLKSLNNVCEVFDLTYNELEKIVNNFNQ